MPNNGSFKEKFPSNLCVDRNGDAWVVTTGKGIYKYNKHTDRFDKVIAKDGETLDGKYFAQASEDVDGTLILHQAMATYIATLLPTMNLRR